MRGWKWNFLDREHLEVKFHLKLHNLQRCSRRAPKGDEIFYGHINRIHGTKQPTGVKITSRLPRITSVD